MDKSERLIIVDDSQADIADVRVDLGADPRVAVTEKDPYELTREALFNSPWGRDLVVDLESDEPE